VTSTLSIVSIVIPLAILVPLPAQAGSANPWDGTWSGVLNKSDPVSVTIADGKVVAYSIRGATPYPIQFSRVTYTTVSFGDRTNYNVRIVKVGDKVASGFAHSPIGDGSASLTKQ
jgi:hypothetical protein